jgi:hypothetical protein
MTIIVKSAQSDKEIKAAKKKLKDKEKRPALADFYGKLKGKFGDGLAYQKQIRDDWD